MATTKIILLHHKARKNGEIPVYIRLIKNRQTKYYSLQINVLPKYWDEDAQKVKPNHPNSIRMNKYIAEKTRIALDGLLDKETDDPSSTVNEIKEALQGKAPVEFFAYAGKFNKLYENKGKIGTYKRFEAVVSKLKAYVNGKELTIKMIDTAFLKKYEDHLRTFYKNTNNTVIANFRAIRRILNEAVEDKHLEFAKNPFLTYKLTWKNTEKVFLTEEEIAAIEDLPLDKESMKYHHRNMYILACYAGGIRISDLITLKWSNFDNTHLLLNTQKTGSVISIKLPEKAISIIKSYHSKDSKKESFIFPFLDKYADISTPTKLHTAISSITAYTNTDLKDLANDAGIEKHVHFHTSRHTWATRALRKGMRIEYVSKLMGHASIKTTQVYAKIVNADLDKAMEVFDNKPVPPIKPESKVEKSK